MPNITILAAMSTNRVIGKDNKLPWHLPSDLQWFKNITDCGILIMGRKTFESIGRPLPNRVNVVLSHQPVPVAWADKLIWSNSIPDVLELCKTKYPRKEIFVIGGSEIYNQFLSIADHATLTMIDGIVEGDAYFPEMPNDWRNRSSYHNLIPPTLMTGPESYSYHREFWAREQSKP